MYINEITIIKHATEDVLGTIPRLLAEFNKTFSVIDITKEPLPKVETLDCVFILGSLESAYNDKLPWLKKEIVWLQEVIKNKIPVLGICFGSQLLARVLGGKAYKNERPEHDWVELELLHPDWQFQGPWFSFHFDTFDLPGDVQLLARTDVAKQAFKKNNMLGVQFHPEINQDMFESWLEGWASNQEGKQFLAEQAELINRLEKEIQENSEQNYKNFKKLMEYFFSLNSSLGK